MCGRVPDIAAAWSENCFTLAKQMWIYYSAHARSGTSFPCFGGAVGDRLAAAASVRATAHATNAGSEYSLISHTPQSQPTIR